MIARFWISRFSAHVFSPFSLSPLIVLVAVTGLLSSAPEVPSQTPSALSAVLRSTEGRRHAKRVRREGYTPAFVFSLPGETSEPIAIDTLTVNRLLKRVGRMGFAATVFDLTVEHRVVGAEPALSEGPWDVLGRREPRPEPGAGLKIAVEAGLAVESEVAGAGEAEPAAAGEAAAPPSSTSSTTLRVLGRQVHVNPVTDEVENLTFIPCPPSRVVRVDVPIRFYGEEACPGVKAGGRVHAAARTVPVWARGDAVPTAFEVDVSALAVGDKILLGQVDIPHGCILASNRPEHPIVVVKRR